MSLIDDRGRVFGRVNLIDAIVMIVVLGLIPLAYGAFLMFRPPAPTITGVSPDHLTANQQGVIEIVGADLRQFLDVHFNGIPSNGLFLRSPTRAEVKVPDLPPGTYDLLLVEEGKVLLTKPAALTVVAPSVAAVVTIELQAAGQFVGLNDADARSVVRGAKFPTDAGQAAEVLAVRAPEVERGRVKVGENAFVSVPLAGQVRVPAVIRVRCAFLDGMCRIGTLGVVEGATIGLQAPDGLRRFRFEVARVRPADASTATPPAMAAVATLRVRFLADAGVLDLMRPGDVDVPGSGVVADSDRAVLTQLASDRQPTTAQMTLEGLLRRSVQVPQVLFAVTGTVRVPVVYTAAGWSYKDRLVKNGAGFNFETGAGGMSGWILDMKIGSDR